MTKSETEITRLTAENERLKEQLKAQGEQEPEWRTRDRDARLVQWYTISELLRTADNSHEYSYKHVIHKGKDIGTVGNLLVEMTPITSPVREG